jgi:hypothetical protein
MEMILVEMTLIETLAVETLLSENPEVETIPVEITVNYHFTRATF